MSQDLDATHYTQNSSFQYSVAMDLLSKQTLQEQKIKTILDLGCGDGKITQELSQMFTYAQVHGVDPSPSMIEHAKNMYSNNPNLHFEMQSAEEYKPKHAFDLITAFHSFHWMRDPLKVLTQMALHLQPRGEALILTYPKESPYWEAFETVLSQSKWSAYYPNSVCPYWVSIQDYETQLSKLKQEYNFTYVIHQKMHHARYDSPEDLFNYIKGWIPCLTQIDKEPSHQLLKDICKYIEHKYDHHPTRIPYLECILHIQRGA